ncbi:MAG: ACT domain-containing protein, partial [Actinobacteria bacterium]|nr:ACT domain-containing protein [Actinomycetota bacterium]
VNVANGAAARLSITEKARLRSVDELSSQYYLTMVVSDEPGVLAQVATVFGTHGVSIQVMEQSGTGGDAELCLILHETTEAALHATLSELDGLDVVRGIGSVIRLVSGD